MSSTMRAAVGSAAALIFTALALTVEQSSAAASRWTHPRTFWGDPDLQGTWPVTHLISVPLQRPPQYGDRLTLTAEELAEQRNGIELRNGAYRSEESGNRLGLGHWAEATGLPIQTSLIVDPPNGQLPAQTEAGQKMSAQMGSSWNHQVFDSVADFDTWDRCITRGMPASMFPVQYNNGIQILQAPGYVVIDVEMIHEARIVPIRRMSPPDAEVKQWMGSSRGHWEGTTLVVETTHFNGETSQTSFGTPGAPIGPRAASTSMKIIERFERTSDNDLTYTVTVDDPVTQSAPWTARLQWKRDDHYQFFEYACHEDNEAVRNYITSSRANRASQAVK